MRTFFLFLFLAFHVSAQTHDPALDSINSTAGDIDATLNGWYSTRPWLTTNDVDRYGSNSYSAAFQWAGQMFTNATTNASYVGNAYSNLFNYSLSFTNSGSGTNMGLLSTNPPLNPSLIDMGWFAGVHYQFDLTVWPTSDLSKWGDYVRAAVVGMVWLMIFWWTKEVIDEKVFGTLNQRQIEGPKVSVFGWSFSSVVGVFICTLLIAYILLSLQAVTLHSLLNKSFSASVAITSVLAQAPAKLPAWDVMTCFVPLNEIFGAMVSYWTFRYMLLTPIFLGVRSVILAISS